MIPIKAKFTSKCKKCGGQIEKGEDCWYQPGAGVWHMDCREDENIMQEPAESIIQATKPKDSKYKVGDRVIYNNEEYTVVAITETAIDKKPMYSLSKFYKDKRIPGEPVVEEDKIREACEHGKTYEMKDGEPKDVTDETWAPPYKKEYCIKQIKEEEWLWDMRHWNKYHDEQEVREWVESMCEDTKNCGHTAWCIRVLMVHYDMPVDEIVKLILSNDKIKYPEATKEKCDRCTKRFNCDNCKTQKPETKKDSPQAQDPPKKPENNPKPPAKKQPAKAHQLKLTDLLG